MALNKTNVAVSFAQGLDTKSDEKQVVPGRLLELENGVFTKFGSINKRFGYSVLGRDELDSTNITTGEALSTFKRELALFTGSNMLSYSEANDAWAPKGRVVSVLMESRPIVQNSNAQSVPSVATEEGVTVYAWEDSSGGVRVSAIDQNTGNFLLSDALVSETGILPKCVALNRAIYVFYIEGTTIKYRQIHTLDPTVLGAAKDFATNVDDTDKVYDVLLVGTRIFLVWNNNNNSSGISLQFMNTLEQRSVEIEYEGEAASTCAVVFTDQANNIWVAWHDGSDVKAFIYDYNLSSEILSVTTIETISDVRNITGTVEAATAILLYEISEENSYDHYIKTNTLAIGGAVGAPEVFLRSVGLASKWFTYDNNRYVATVYDSDLQSTYFIVNGTAEIIAKVNSNLAGGLTTKSILPEVVEYQPGVFIFAGQLKGRLRSEAGSLFTLTGVNSTLIDFVANNRFQSATLGENLHIAGGILYAYDGYTVVEHGFHIFPENISHEVETSDGSIDDGTYQYSVIWEWTDNYGQIHRSAPSIPLSVEVSEGNGAAKVTLTIPTLRLTRKSGVRIVVYRTENGGSIFYRLNSISSPLLNDPGTNSVIYEDTVSDSSIIANEILYTTGGVVENIAAPSGYLITEYENRLVLAGLADPNTFLLSKERFEGEPVAFSDLFLKRVESKGGGIGAMGVIDGKLILFKKNSQVYWVTGSGPNELGVNDDMTTPQPLPTDVGCDNPNSVVLTPIGLMFQANGGKGIHLLDRSLQVSYKGAPVERYNDLAITSASLVPNTNQVRFVTKDGPCLVYDYLFDQWSTFTNHEAEDCLVWNNRFVFLKKDGRVFREERARFQDDNLPIKMKVTTAWLSLAGIQGFQRIYKLLLLGDYKSDHKLIVKVGYDFNEYFTQEVVIDTGELLENATYGQDSPYGQSEYYGGQYRLYQFRIPLQKQKCQSVRFSIEDFQLENFGEGFSISNVALEVGLKKGLAKKGSDRTFGVA